MDRETFSRGVDEATLRLPFHDRGFSHETIVALVDCSIERQSGCFL
jgi:hypothetical protein